jgi:FlaA1/EpsC-like NDP-sugar epimerase
MRSFNPNTIKLLILTTDICLSVVSFFISILLIQNFSFSFGSSVIKTIAIIAAIRGLCFFFFRTYAFIIRYFGLQDLAKLYIATGAGSVSLLTINFISKYNTELPISLWIIDFIILIFLLSSERFLMRYVQHNLAGTKVDGYNTILFGAGESGSITAKVLDGNKSQPYHLKAIFDDNPNVHYKNLNGIRVYPPSVFDKFIQKNNITHAILSIQNINLKRKRELIELCLKYDIIVREILPAEKWLNGQFDVQNIQNINVEQLLSRPPIKLNYENIATEIKGKIVLVTGGAGSIGSEIVRQCIQFQPEKIIILDQAESPLVQIGLEISEELKYKQSEIVIADVTDKTKIEAIFNLYKPHIVFHAAAYKHVPIMEMYPAEAVKVNIGGTKNIADASVKHGVEKFVMVSTDKAVNPTNVMGASKRIAEIYIQSLNAQQTDTLFITTRFGNVLGSNGSVLLRFKKQIESRQPITVTHPDIIRYFMTIPEACQLVLEAGAMGEGGEIFIFDMGEPVKILDLAINTIKLAGLQPYKDIDIVFTGLRPGEKLYEELLNDNELTLPTHNDKIKKAKVRFYEYTEISPKIDTLISQVSKNDEMQLVKLMKTLVPEFFSNMSIFSTLDPIKEESLNGQL